MKAIYTPTPCIKLFGKVLVLACLLFFSGRANATIRYVAASSTGAGTSWSDASGDLVAMINASSSGDQVWVMDGDYLNTPTFSMKDGVKIYGGFGGFETDPAQRDLSVYESTLYSNGGATIIQNNGGLTATALLDGFRLTGSTNIAVRNNNGSSPTFANCTFDTNKTTGNGGGMSNTNSSPTLINCYFSNNKAAIGGAIYNYFNSLPILSNCTFESNKATSNGGGIYNANSSSVTLTNCTFTSNTAGNYGGGIHNDFLSLSSSVTNCTFTGNTANSGGGIYNSVASSSFTNCTFTSNTGSFGGGIYIYNPSSPSFTNCIFNNNTANSWGGAIYGQGCSPVFMNCTISGNNANTRGGGMYYTSSSSTLTNCLVSGNTSTNGGGLYFSSSSPSVLTNCTISGNSASANGGGIYNYSNGANVNIRNTIIYNNSSGIYNSGGSPAISYSLVQGGTDITNGNIVGTTDPLFVSALAPGQNAGGDYSLQPCSPVINKGSNSYYAGGQSPDLSAITTDLAANARFYNSGTVDMGSYEKQGVTIAADASGILYVKPGGTGTGESWSCATGDLQEAINAAVSGNQIWVAGGTYMPNRRADATTAITTGDRNDAFVLKSGIKIYGGFAGTETSLSNRNLALTANASILSSDLNGDDNGFTNNSENAYHVVISAGDVGTAELNGFTIQGGNCDGSVAITVNGQPVGTNGGGAINCTNSSPTLNHLIIKGNAGRYGAGLCFSSSSPAISNSIIYGNAGFYGGGIIASNSGANLTNVLISGNTAVEQGGGMYNEFAVAPTLTNVTITGNTANYNSGAMYNNLGPSLNIRNSIIYGNNTGINNNNGTPTIQYSLVQGETSTANGNISGATDPLFVNPQAAGLSTSGNYSLQACSPAINAGTNTVYGSGQSPNLSAITTDLNSTTRKQGSSVDMGVYEFAGSYNGNPGDSDLLAINGDAGTVASVSGNTTFTASASICRLITTVLPNGSSPIYGNVTAKAWIDTTGSFDSNYVKRHYEISGLHSLSFTTGRVTLYFTQTDFDTYNAVKANTLQLPTSATDEMGKARLVIEKYYGSSIDGSGLLASYHITPTIINPYNSDIVWNSTLGRWEVSFDVTGFGGFFVKTQTVTLPLTLLGFTGSRYNGYNQMQWKTADEVNTRNFILERSADGSNYTAIAIIAASGAGNSTYSYKDYITFSGKIFYRLKMVDIDGHYTYSTIVTLINTGNNAVSIYPNPASDVLHINAGTDLLYSQAGLYDANGRLLQTILITTAPQAINVQQLTNGLYILKFANGAIEKFIKK